MIEKVKTNLRISSSVFDADEIQELIDSARDDLKLAGVSPEKADAEYPDSLIKRAIITYCKANFGYDNPDAERFEQSYLMLKQHLTLAGDYRDTVG
ncbi:head-tail connector protein [Salipaludibacillus sp. CF4.18]|uniref:head-tail connector protein n=1 Tax=Salipaludibacillus sp. CF4.18 TaxID=3373081 RepID=UPI003EE57B99